MILHQVLAALEIDSIEEPTTKSVVAATAGSPMSDGGGGEAVVVNGCKDEGSCCSEEQAAANGGDGNVATNRLSLEGNLSRGNDGQHPTLDGVCMLLAFD